MRRKTFIALLAATMSAGGQTIVQQTIQVPGEKIYRIRGEDWNKLMFAREKHPSFEEYLEKKYNEGKIKFLDDGSVNVTLGIIEILKDSGGIKDAAGSEVMETYTYRSDTGD